MTESTNQVISPCHVTPPARGTAADAGVSFGEGHSPGRQIVQVWRVTHCVVVRALHESAIVNLKGKSGHEEQFKRNVELHPKRAQILIGYYQIIFTSISSGSPKLAGHECNSSSRKYNFIVCVLARES